MYTGNKPPSIPIEPFLDIQISFVIMKDFLPKFLGLTKITSFSLDHQESGGEI